MDAVGYSDSEYSEDHEDVGEDPHESDVPKPLQIKKRVDNRDLDGATVPESANRSCSSGTSESLGSAPELPGADQPLNVPKRRLHKSEDGLASPIPKGGYEAGQTYVGGLFHTGEEQVPDGEYLARPKRSASCKSPLRDQEYEAPPRLSNKASLLFLRKKGPAAYPTDTSSDRQHNLKYPIKSKVPATPLKSRRISKSLRIRKSFRPTTPSIRSQDEGRPQSPVSMGVLSHSFPESDSDNYPPDPYILVPRITVTPECKTLDDGTVTFWAAVQVSTQLCRPNVPDQVWLDDHRNRFGTGSSEIFHYGCLYDVNFDIMSTPNSSVVGVLDDQAYSNTLYPGSRVLKLAHVCLLSTAPPRGLGHIRQNSDDLIEDLEYQLGSTMTEYLQVRLTYRHSGFPQQQERTAWASSDGTAAVETRLETSATAVIKRYNPTSQWSPRPAPQPNPLFEIIASHWGPESANNVMYRIMASRSNRSTPRKAANLHGSTPTPPLAPPSYQPSSEETVRPMAPPTRAAPPVPKREASLQRALWSSLEEDEEPAQSPVPARESESDPARKIWTEMRRTSTGSRPSYHVSRVRRVPSTAPSASGLGPDPASVGVMMRISPPHAAHVAPATLTNSFSSGRMLTGVERQREEIRERALRNRRSVGADTLRSLVPTVADLHLDGKDLDGQGAHVERRGVVERGPAAGETGVSLGHRMSVGSTGKGRREKDKEREGRWGGWSWWQ